jgi:HSP20 family protein
MELMKWRPARDLFNVHNRLNSMFDDFMLPTRFVEDRETLWGWNPAVDVYENDDAIVVKAELPGMEKDQIAVDVQGRVLSIKGERASDNEINEERYYRRERTHGRFERALTLPAEVNPESIKAEYKDGILKVEVPKPEAHKARKITVQ